MFDNRWHGHGVSAFVSPYHSGIGTQSTTRLRLTTSCLFPVILSHFQPRKAEGLTSSTLPRRRLLTLQAAQCYHSKPPHSLSNSRSPTLDLTTSTTTSVTDFRPQVGSSQWVGKTMHRQVEMNPIQQETQHTNYDKTMHHQVETSPTQPETLCTGQSKNIYLRVGTTPYRSDIQHKNRRG